MRHRRKLSHIFHSTLDKSFIGIQGENFFLLAVAPRWGQPVYTYWRACRDSVWTEKVFTMKHNDWCMPNSIDTSAWWEWRKRKWAMKKTHEKFGRNQIFTQQQRWHHRRESFRHIIDVQFHCFTTRVIHVDFLWLRLFWNGELMQNMSIYDF